MLKIWLPLNGNMNNVGLTQTTTTQNGAAATYEVGRFPKCLVCNGSTYWTISPLTLGTTASMSWWAKTTDTSAMFWVLNAAVYSSLNFWLYNAKYYLNVGDSLNNPFQNNGSDVAGLADGKWHHYVTTFNGSVCNLYIDGTFYGKAKTYKSPATNGATNIKLAGGFGNGHDYDTLGSMCDFRVFDHCISEQDVKELYWGKTLDFNGLNWTLPKHENTWPAGKIDFNTAYNATYGTYGFNTGTSIFQTYYYEKNKFGVDAPVIKVYTTTDKAAAYPYVYFDAMYLAPTSAAGNTFKCLSFDYWPTSRNQVSFYSYRAGYVCKYLLSDGTWSNWTSTCYIPVTVKSWNHIVVTWAYSGATQANMGSGPGYMTIGTASAATTTADYWLFKNIQVESREEPTEYSNVTREQIDADRSAMIYPLTDYNTVISGSNIYFNGSTSYVGFDTLNISGGSISVWLNVPSKPTVQRIIYYDPGSKMVMGFLNDGTILTAANGAKNRWQTTAMNWGQMNHILAVWDATRNPTAVYINGTLAGTGGTSNWTTAGTASAIGRRIGVTSYDDYLQGYINNLQVFTSQLTAADAQYLYSKGPQKKEMAKVHEMWRDMYLDYSGCTWLKVLHHSNPATQLFTVANGSNNDNPDLFSKLYLFDDTDRFKRPDGKYEFMVREKLESSHTESAATWVQTSSPTASAIAGYQLLSSTPGAPSKLNGLTHQDSRAVFDDAGSSTWWCSCGCNTAYQGGIPGFFGLVTSGYIDLYIRVDDTNFFDKT